MRSVSVSLPDELQGFIDERVREGGYGSTAEYVRELIRRDRERLALRRLVLEGLASEDAGEMDAEYFDELRAMARRRAADVA